MVLCRIGRRGSGGLAEKSRHGVSWHVGYEHFVAHLEQNGSGPIPASLVCADGFRLGSWVRTQRSFRRSGRMTPQRRALLDQHSFEWEPAAAAQAANIALLAEYEAAFGDLNVPVMHRSASGKPIGKWLQAQIASYHAGTLHEGVRTALEDLGVDWSHGRVDPFDTALAELRRYIELTGNTHVPNSYVSTSGFALGSWFAKNKSLMKQGSLPSHRNQQLRDLGVDPNRDVKEEAWFQGFERLREYHGEVGDARVPSYFQTADGYPLGPWRRVQRTKLARGKLREDRIAMLDALDASWNETRPTGWSDEQALAALREAATMAYPLTSGEYENLRVEGALTGPAHTWFAHHYPSWKAACDAAGVDGGTDRSGSVMYSDAEMDASALQFFTECGFAKGSSAYTEWVSDHPGLPGAAAMIRRFGSWPKIRERLASMGEAAD